MKSILISILIIFIFYSFSFNQENLQSIAGYKYSKFNEEWFTVVNGKQGDLVDINRLVVRLIDKGKIENYDFNKKGFTGFEIITPRFVDGFYQLKILEKSDPFAVAKALDETGDFDVIHFSAFYETHNTPNDQYFGEQWGLHNIGQSGGTPDADIDAPEAWDITTGNSDIIISIIDDGVDYYHEDLDGNIWPGIGYDFYDDDPDPFPVDWAPHGTCVAGIAAAQTNNFENGSYIGVAGVAGGWGTSIGSNIMIMDAGYWYNPIGGSLIDVVAATLATDSSASWGAKVINMSFGGSEPLPELESAINNAVNDYDVVVVASAGNNGGEGSEDDSIRYPAKYSNTIAVGATVRDDSRWSTSGWYGSTIGPELDVMAPGGASIIYTTDITGGQGYNTGDYNSSFGGTSASAPHIAGTAALIRSVNPSLTWDEVRDILRKSTDKVPGMEGQNRTDEYGWGRINAYKAVFLARGYGHLTSNITFYDDLELRGDVIIDEGVTITIKPDVTITFAANSDAYNEGISPYSSEFIVKGKVILEGTPGDPIVFQSTSGTVNSWIGIRFEDQSDDASTIKNCRIKDALWGIRLQRASPTITDNFIRNNVVGVFLYYSHSHLKNNEILSNTLDGLMIYYGNGLGYDLIIEDNDISNNNYRGVYVNNSSPIFLGKFISSNGLHGIHGLNQFDADLYAYGGAENTIIHNSQRGFSIGSNSTSCLGTKSKPGYNTIMDNQSYELYNGGGGHCTAQFNYWGADPPDEDEFYTTGGSTITYAPWLPDPLEKLSLIYSDILPTNRSDLTKFSEFTNLYFNGNYQSAIKLGLVLLDSLRQNSRAANVLGLLWHAFRKTNNLPGFVSLLDHLIKKYPGHKISGWAKMFQAAILAIDKDYTNVLQLYQNVASQFPNSQIECKALYEQFLIYFMEFEDYNTAQVFLSDLQQKYPDKEFTLCALEFYNSFSPVIGPPQINRNITSISQNTQKIKEFKLHQNYPNPFNPETIIRYDLPKHEVVVFEIYDISGRKIRSLVNKSMEAGSHQVVWDGHDEFGNQVATGMYFYRIKAGSFQNIKKMVLLR